MMVRRALTPLLLAIIGLILLIGCIPFPGAYHPTRGGERPEKKIGDSDSKAPLKLGQSTLADVINVLGDPRYRTRDNRVVAYGYQIQTGTTFYPLCFYAQRNLASRFLVVRFGDSGAIESYEVQKHLLQVPRASEPVESQLLPNEYHSNVQRPMPATQPAPSSPSIKP